MTISFAPPAAGRRLGRRLLLGLTALAMASLLPLPRPVAAQGEIEKVRLETSLGAIDLELDGGRAPATVANFLRYADDGFYDGLIFHRVIPGFMIQGGGYTGTLDRRPTRNPIGNEADNGLTNQRGTIAMARTADPHSATAQFFINLVDNANLDHRAKDQRGWGYAVFGRVVAGMAVVDAIAAVKTGAQGPFRSDFPLEPITIKHVRRLP